MTLSAFPGSVLAESLAESGGEVLGLLEAGLEEGGRDGSAVLSPHLFQVMGGSPRCFRCAQLASAAHGK